MGILDAFFKHPEQLGDLAKFATDNPQIAKAAKGLFSSAEGSTGGAGGLGGILSALQENGLGDAVSSWLGSGANKGVTPDQVQSALGSDTVSKFAEQAGISGSEAKAALSRMLPDLVDKLSPDGKLPDAGGLESKLSGLLGKFS